MCVRAYRENVEIEDVTGAACVKVSQSNLSADQVCVCVYVHLCVYLNLFLKNATNLPRKNASSYTPNHTHTHTYTHTQVIHAAQPSYKDVVKSSLEEEQYRMVLKEKDQEIADLRKKLEEDRYVAKYAWSVRMIE